MIFERKLSDIVCDNTSLDELQKFAFKMASESNPVIKCKEVFRAKLDFAAIAQMIAI